MTPDIASVPDKYSAVWVSHSSISDFLKCPRLYQLRNVYKDPRTGHKMAIMSPPMALGQAVHEVIESLAVLPVESRLKISLVRKLDPIWQKISGKKGGFENPEAEKQYRDRATQMLINLQEDPGPILNKAIKIKTGTMDLPIIIFHLKITLFSAVRLTGSSILRIQILFTSSILKPVKMRKKKIRYSSRFICFSPQTLKARKLQKHPIGI